MTISEALLRAKKLFDSAVDTPDLDAELLLAHVLGVSREYLFAHPEQELSKSSAAMFTKYLKKRKKGVPVSELLREKEFFGLRFFVNTKVLTPRPETEALVEKVLEMVKSKKTSTILDIGTGSGCIAIALAKNLPAQHVIYGLDLSRLALSVARKNAENCAVSERIRFLRSDLLQRVVLPDDVPRPLVLVANLPYIPESEYLPPEVLAADPPEALWAGVDGLDLYRRFFREFGNGIRSKRTNMLSVDFCLFEFHPPQWNSLREMVKQNLPEYRLDFFNDLTGTQRFGLLESKRND